MFLYVVGMDDDKLFSLHLKKSLTKKISEQAEVDKGLLADNQCYSYIVKIAV